MKTLRSLLILCLILSGAGLTPAQAKTTEYQGKGEVISVDPPYQRLTIRHGAIKGFSGDTETEFALAASDLFNGINKRDLVEFTVVDTNGDVKIEKIKKTGEAPPEEKTKLGKVVQDMLVTTGEVAKGVTTPIPPAHEVVSGTVGATTHVTGSVLNEADSEVKAEF